MNNSDLGVDPVGTFTLKHYELGSMLLTYLEQEVLKSPRKMDSFLRKYVEKFSQKSIKSDKFQDFFDTFLKGFQHKPSEKGVNWNYWFDKAIPKDKLFEPKFDNELLKDPEKLAERWQKDNITEETFEYFDELKFEQKIWFFERLLNSERSLNFTQLVKMSKMYKMEETASNDILFYWIRVGLKARWQPIVPKALSLVNQYGRVKFLRTIYTELNNMERQVAVENFQKNKKKLSDVAVKIVSDILGLPNRARSTKNGEIVKQENEEMMKETGQDYSDDTFLQKFQKKELSRLKEQDAQLWQDVVHPEEAGQDYSDSMPNNDTKNLKNITYPQRRGELFRGFTSV